MATPENEHAVTDTAVNNDVTYLDYLSNTQQDDLPRKFILQERTQVPEARCSECSNRSCKNCQIMQSYNSYAAYQSYQRMYNEMQLVKI